MYGYDIMRHSAYSDIQTQWNVMCKYIKITWPKLADTCKCAVPRGSGIYAPTCMQPSSRFKNYILNSDLRAKLLEIVKDDDNVKARENMCAQDKVYDPALYNELLLLDE